MKCEFCHQEDVSYDEVADSPRGLVVERNGRRMICFLCAREIALLMFQRVLMLAGL